MVNYFILCDLCVAFFLGGGDWCKYVTWYNMTWNIYIYSMARHVQLYWNQTDQNSKNVKHPRGISEPCWRLPTFSTNNLWTVCGGWSREFAATCRSIAVACSRSHAIVVVVAVVTFLDSSLESGGPSLTVQNFLLEMIWWAFFGEIMTEMVSTKRVIRRARGKISIKCSVDRTCQTKWHSSFL